ncbi:MAG: septum formation initiator family protein [Bacteroidales bacterium]|nr:septum formation initiator family protein [Bacteroidales bacterium]MCI1785167.1 septum formation initiator family protein [Bacteroidales bacterium]
MGGLGIYGKLVSFWRNLGGGNKEKRSFLRYAIVATSIFIILVGFLNQDNLVRWVNAGFQIRKQEKQIKLYKKEIKEMDKQIDMLSTDRDTLEKFAREKFHFAEPGDDVYILGK